MRDQPLDIHYQLETLLRAGRAHIPFNEIVNRIPQEERGTVINGLPYSPWQLVEHMRITQWDILESVRTPDHISPDFPEMHWPPTQAPPSENAWEESLISFREDANWLAVQLADRNVDLIAPVPGDRVLNLVEAAHLIATHNAYHLGQLMVLCHILIKKL